MASETKEPKLTIPAGISVGLNAMGEPVVELLTVPGNPVVPLADPIVEALIIEHLNSKQDTKRNRIEIVKALLLAQAHRNGVKETTGDDLYMESPIVIAIVLYVLENPADGLQDNTLEIRTKLEAFAKLKHVDTGEWPKRLNWFSKQIKDNIGRLRKYGVVAKKVADGNRSWIIRLADANDANDAKL